MFQRSSGILMHISSLPSQYGIGDFGQEAYKFIEFLAESKQKLLQILPMGHTG
ncbi:MAG: 4-alpha-glucanotransferase, partial [Fusobacteriaceae bacterium]